MTFMLAGCRHTTSVTMSPETPRSHHFMRFESQQAHKVWCLVMSPNVTRGQIRGTDVILNDGFHNNLGGEV